MKKIFLIIFICSVFCGCGGNFNKSEKINVCTSFWAMADFAAQIGGEKAEIINLVPNGGEPHDRELSVGNMLSLEKADIFIYNGLGMESFVERVKKSVENNKLIFVEASQGCKINYGYEHGHEEGEEHQHKESEHHLEDADPHVWLNPLNACIEAKNICNAFCEADPKNEEYYKNNYEIFEKKAIELDNACKTVLGGLKNKHIVVSHGAYGYICTSYGLSQEAVEGMGGSGDPSPQKVKEIYEYIRKNNIECIFYDSLTEGRTAKAIAEDLGIRVFPICSFEGISAEQVKAGKSYFDVMYDNLTELKKNDGEGD